MSLIGQINRETAEDAAQQALNEARASIAELHAEPSWLEHQPCGCHACNEQVQLGHFACSVPDASMLEAEARGEVYRQYTDVDAGGKRHRSSAWRWFWE